MNIFGQTLDGQQLFGLITLVAALGVWLMVWRRERSSTQWFREWEARRKARREAEDNAGPPSDHRRGPWG